MSLKFRRFKWRFFVLTTTIGAASLVWMMFNIHANLLSADNDAIQKGLDQIWLHRLNMPQNIESLNLPSRKKFLKASNLPKHYKSLKSLNLPERKKHFKSLDILKNKKSFNPSNLNLSKVELSDSGDITVQNLKTLKSKLSILQSLFSVKEMESFINPKLLQYLKLLNAEVPESQIGNNAALSSTTTSAEVKISTASNIALTNIKSMVARATAFKNSEKKLRSSKNQDKELDADFLSSSNLSILSESLYFKTLERVRNAYQAVLQSQLYTRDMLGHFSDGNLSPSLDKPQNLEMSNEVKAMHENLVPYEMIIVNQLEEQLSEYKPDIANKLRSLQKKIQKRLYELQHPSDCKKAHRLICIINARCGLGCLLHHYANCMIMGLGTNRTVILTQMLMIYQGLDQAFQSVNEICKNIPAGEDLWTIPQWKGDLSNSPTPNDIQVVRVSLQDSADWKKTIFAPFNIPDGIADTVQRYHGDPDVWWIGQIVKYVTRLQPNMKEVIEKLKIKLKFKSPIVGIHVRRTDKKHETPYRPLRDYMYHAKRWYDRYDLKNGNKTQRKIFLATEDPDVIAEARKAYSNYEFSTVDNVVNTIFSMLSRFSKEGVMRIVADVVLLKECDYFVGTYSSNIGRLVYELMQAEGERTFDSISVDFAYHYWGGFPHAHVAIEDHKPREGEIELRVGDRLRVRAEKYAHYMGFAENMRTHHHGVYPMHKVKPVIVPVHFPGL